MKAPLQHIVLLLLFVSFTGLAQQNEMPEKKETSSVKAAMEVTPEQKNFVREGNELYRKKNFVDAEVKYKKVLEINPTYEKANFNLGDAIYEQNRFQEAAPYFESVTKMSEDKKLKSEAFHNLGNISMKQKQYAQAIEAYKNALRLNPKDEETRYNLALAKKLLKDQQQKQNKKDKNKDKDKDQKDQNKDKNKDQNQDQQKDKDKDKNNDQNKDQQNKDQNQKNKDQQKDKQDQKKKQQPKPNQLNKQQQQQLLEAMNKEENKTQKKVNAKRAKGRKLNQDKDW